VLGYSASHAAVAGHIAFAMAFGPIALLVDAFAAAAGVLAAAGLWLAVSPWVLGYAARGVAAWASEVLAGLALVVLARSARPTVTLPADPPEGRP
jgi:hypothetical protein